HRLTGVPITQWQRHTPAALEEFRWMRFALMPESRIELQRMLAARFEGMLRAGLLEEVRHLRAQWQLTERHPSMRAVGYRQLSRFLREEGAMEEETQEGVRATAQLAKRQLTWLRREERTTKLPANLAGRAA